MTLSPVRNCCRALTGIVNDLDAVLEDAEASPVPVFNEIEQARLLMVLAKVRGQLEGLLDSVAGDHDPAPLQDTSHDPAGVLGGE
jgi:hypothetical protein